MMKIACLLQRTRRNKRGFTLVELLVVVAILGILAAIAVPRVVQNIQSARLSADAANERMILNALEAYYLQMTATGPRLGYPASLIATGTGTFNEFFGSLPAVPAGLPNVEGQVPRFRPYAERFAAAGTGTGNPPLHPGFTWTFPDGTTFTR